MLRRITALTAVLAVICVTWSPAAVRRAVTDDGDSLLVVEENWGLAYCDRWFRPLLPAPLEPDHQDWHWDRLGAQPVDYDPRDLQYAARDSSGAIVRSGIQFPDPEPPENGDLLYEILEQGRESFGYQPNQVAPFYGEVRVAYIPVRLYAQLGDTIYWDDPDFFIHPYDPWGRSIDFDQFYQLLFSAEWQPGSSSAYGKELGYSLPQLWGMNQDEPVSECLPDTARCSWYGEYPGWAAGPDGQPWHLNIFDVSDMLTLVLDLEAQGLDLEGRDPHHPVIFLFSGNHFTPEIVAWPHAGMAFANVWASDDGFPVGDALDQVGVGYLQHLLLQITAQLRQTFIQLGYSEGSYCWDLMGMGYRGYANHGDPPLAQQEIHWPALIGGADRLRLDWAQQAVDLSVPGDYLLDGGKVYYTRNPGDYDEFLAFHSWDGTPDAPMQHHEPSLEVGGTGLVFHSHGAYRSWWSGLEYVPEIIRSEYVSQGQGGWPWNEDYAPFPSPGNSELDFSEWASPAAQVPFGWTAGFSVEPQTQSTLLHWDHAPAVAVEVIAQDGIWQREVPLGFASSLPTPLYNLGLPIYAAEVRSEDDRGWIDQDFSISLEGEYGQNESIDVSIPPGSLQLPAHQDALGLVWELDVEFEALDPAAPAFVIPTNDPIIGMRPFGVTVPDVLPGDPSASDAGYLAVARDSEIRVFSDDLTLQWTLSAGGSVRQLLIANVAGNDASEPELVVLTDTRVLVFSLSQHQDPALLPGWPANGSALGPCMVFQDSGISEHGIICYVDGESLVLRRGDGTFVEERMSLPIPSASVPVDLLAYAGGDELGPRFAVTGGSTNEQTLSLFDATGATLLQIDDAEFEGRMIDMAQLLTGDFLHNGFYDLVMIANVEPVALGEPDEQWLMVGTWSATGQAWGHSWVEIGPAAMIGTGPEAMAPLFPDSPWEPVRLAFNVWSLDSQAEDDSSHVFILELSNVNWAENTLQIDIPGGMQRRHLLTGDLDDDGLQDILPLARGRGVEFLRGTDPSFGPWSDGYLVHNSAATDWPLPLMISGELHLGLLENGELVFYNTESTNWPVWSSEMGPGNSGQVGHLANPGLLPPQISISLQNGDPMLTFEPHPPCTAAVIYRSAEPYGEFEAVDEVPWDGSWPLQWIDHWIPEDVARYFYRATVVVDFEGPDGAIFH